MNQLQISWIIESCIENIEKISSEYLKFKKAEDVYFLHRATTGLIPLVDRAYPNSSTPNNPLGDNFAKTEKEIEEIVR